MHVGPAGVRVYADDEADEMACTCNLTSERETLMQILRGERDAVTAIM